MPLKPGDKVVMHTCMEAKFKEYDGRIWKVKSNEWNLCGSQVVMLEDFSGAFATEFLQKVNLEESATKSSMPIQYVVLSKDQFNDVHIIISCEKEDDAKNIVNKRKENFPDYYCWYQKSEKI